MYFFYEQCYRYQWCPTRRQQRAQGVVLLNYARTSNLRWRIVVKQITHGPRFQGALFTPGHLVLSADASQGRRRVGVVKFISCESSRLLVSVGWLKQMKSDVNCADRSCLTSARTLGH